MCELLVSYLPTPSRIQPNPVPKLLQLDFISNEIFCDIIVILLPRNQQQIPNPRIGLTPVVLYAHLCSPGRRRTQQGS